MNRKVIIKIVPGHDPYEVLEQIGPTGFQFDRVSSITKDYVLLIGDMDIHNIMQLKNFDGVESFQVDGGISKL